MHGWEVLPLTQWSLLPPKRGPQKTGSSENSQRWPPPRKVAVAAWGLVVTAGVTPPGPARSRASRAFSV